MLQVTSCKLYLVLCMLHTIWWTLLCGKRRALAARCALHDSSCPVHTVMSDVACCMSDVACCVGARTAAFAAADVAEVLLSCQRARQRRQPACTETRTETETRLRKDSPISAPRLARVCARQALLTNREAVAETKTHTILPAVISAGGRRARRVGIAKPRVLVRLAVARPLWRQTHKRGSVLCTGG